MASGPGPAGGSGRVPCGRLLRRTEQLRYAGQVGSGFKEDDLKRLAELLEPLRRDTSPFEGRQPPKGTIFVEPRLVVEVEFAEWTRTKTLRAPVFKGVRDDKDPQDVVLEREEGKAARLNGANGGQFLAGDRLDTEIWPVICSDAEARGKDSIGNA